MKLKSAQVIVMEANLIASQTTKKQVIRLKCSECDMGSMKDGLRIRKLEIVA